MLSADDMLNCKGLQGKDLVTIPELHETTKENLENLLVTIRTLQLGLKPEYKSGTIALSKPARRYDNNTDYKIFRKSSVLIVMSFNDAFSNTKIKYISIMSNKMGRSMVVNMKEVFVTYPDVP
jgi:hypothetical protein